MFAYFKNLVFIENMHYAAAVEPTLETGTRQDVPFKINVKNLKKLHVGYFLLILSTWLVESQVFSEYTRYAKYVAFWGEHKASLIFLMDPQFVSLKQEKVKS